MSLEAWLPLPLLSIYLSPGSGTPNAQTACGTDADLETDFSVDSEPPSPGSDELDDYYAEVARHLEGFNIEEAPAQRQGFGVPFDEL